MRSLERNKIQLYYSLYNGKQPVLDDEGNDTGVPQVSYGTVTPFRANLSANKNTTEGEVFGKDLDYSKVICVCEDLPINEYSLIFETEPTSGTEISQSIADYYVVKVAKSLNSTLYAIKSVSKTRDIVTPSVPTEPTTGTDETEVTENGEEND